MPWRVTEAKRIESYTEMVRGLLCMRRYVMRAWSVQSLKAMLEEDHGITDISDADLKLVNDKLHTDGWVEDVPEEEPA